MKHTKPVLLVLLIISILLSLCFSTYFVLPQEIKWLISSVVEVPVCASRIADKLEIQSDFIAVKDYMIQSLKLGMTQEEVEQTLSQFGPVIVGNSFVDEEKKTIMELVVKLCENPMGNVALLVSYSSDGHLMTVVDLYDD